MKLLPKFSTILCSYILVASGSAFIAWAELGPYIGVDIGTGRWGWHLLRDFGVTLFMTGSVSVIFEHYTKKHFLLEILEKSNLARSAVDSGLVAVHLKAHQVQFGKLIDKSSTVEFVSIGARRWREECNKHIRQLFGRGGSFSVFLPDSENEGVLEDLANRLGQDKATAKRAIDDAIYDYETLKGQMHDGELKIYLMPLLPTYSATFCDNQVILTTYSHPRSDGLWEEAPYFVFESGPVLDFYASDVTNLKQLSRLKDPV